jgi:hypothetical protein
MTARVIANEELLGLACGERLLTSLDGRELTTA